MKKQLTFITLMLLSSIVMPLQGHSIFLFKNSLAARLHHESKVLKRGAHTVQKIVKQEKLTDQDTENLKKIGARIAIIAGLTALSISASILLYKKFKASMQLPAHINCYNHHHESTIQSMLQDQETVQALWVVGSLSQRIKAILNEVRRNTTYLFTQNDQINGFVTLKNNHIFSIMCG